MPLLAPLLAVALAALMAGFVGLAFGLGLYSWLVGQAPADRLDDDTLPVTAGARSVAVGGNDLTIDSIIEGVRAAASRVGPNPDEVRRAFLGSDVGDCLASGSDPVRLLAERFDVSEQRVLAALRTLPAT